MDSLFWIRLIASISMMLMSTVLILWHCIFWISCGTVLVTTICKQMLFLLRESERVWLLIQLYECSTIYKHCWETTIHLCGNAVLHVFGVLSMEDFLYTDQACILKYVVPHLYMTPPRALGRRTTEDRGWPWRKFCTPPSPSGPRPPWQTRQHHLSCHPEICISWKVLFFITKK